MKTGIHSLTREEYDASPRINFSTLKHIARSPAHYAHALVTERKDKATLKRGRLVHLALFEPTAFAASVEVWDGAVRRGKEWEAFKAQHADKEIVTPAELKECTSIVAAVLANELAAKYLEKGNAEQTLFWDCEGHECRGRVDWISSAMVDLKVTRDGSPDSFGRDSWNYKSHVQGAWYSDGYLAATGEALEFKLIAVEAEEPHIVQVYSVPETMCDRGRREYLGWLDRLSRCGVERSFPGYSRGELELQIPRWAEIQPEGE